MIEKFQYYLDERLAGKMEVNREEAKSLMNKCAANVSPEACNEALKFLEAFLPKLKKTFENTNETSKTKRQNN